MTHHEERDGVLFVAGGDEMEVVGHDGVGGDADGALLAVRLEQGEEVQPIGVAQEDALLVVAALGEVQPMSGRGEALFAGQVFASVE